MHSTTSLITFLLIGLFTSFAHAQTADPDTLWLKQQPTKAGHYTLKLDIPANKV